MAPGAMVVSAGGSGGAPDVLKHELVRLRDELKLKDAAIEVRRMMVCCGSGGTRQQCSAV